MEAMLKAELERRSADEAMHFLQGVLFVAPALLRSPVVQDWVKRNSQFVAHIYWNKTGDKS